MVTLSRQILYDLLILIIVVDSEADREETSTEEFDTTELFIDILDKLRRVEVVRWLGGACATSSNQAFKRNNCGDARINLAR